MSDQPTTEFQFDESDYARPNQRWLCGRAGEGFSCPVGPSKRGACRAAFECVPYREGDAWKCARTRAQGETCEEGPLPDGGCCRPIARCQPTRSLMAKRGVLSFFVFALALGAGLIMIGSPSRTSVVSPGDLSPQHSSVVHDCADCHVAADGELDDWIHAAFDSNAALEQSGLCLKCHDDLGPQATSPHGMAAAKLAAITTRIESGNRSSSRPLLHAAGKVAFGSPLGKHGTLACAACHREHHGADSALVDTTNHQCQSCHIETFPSFGSGHPEFSQYPYERRSRLYFDHLSHFGQHFAESSSSGTADRSCRDCHEPDAAGRSMLTRGYEQSCASCHSEQIENDLDDGFKLAAFPGLDVAALQDKQEQGVDIGYWPELYPLHVQAAGELGPLMKLLMLADDGFAEVARDLENLDLADLRSATPKQLEQVERLVWAFKETLYDVIKNGQPAIRKRLNRVLGPDVSEAEIAAWSNLIPMQLLTDMQQRWLPNLFGEVETRRAGQQLPSIAAASSRDPATVLEEERAAARAVVAGWYLRDSDMSLRYRPTGHADSLLKTVLDMGDRFSVDNTIDKGPNTQSQNAKSEMMQQMFASLASPFAAGRCQKCHTVDSETPGDAQINWLADRPDSLTRFTKFDHSPHLTLFDNDACFRCHIFRTDEQPLQSLFRPEFVRPDRSPCLNPQEFTSNFAAMKKSLCVECHQPSAAGDSCTSCHSYHIQ